MVALSIVCGLYSAKFQTFQVCSQLLLASYVFVCSIFFLSLCVQIAVQPIQRSGEYRCSLVVTHSTYLCFKGPLYKYKPGFNEGQKRSQFSVEVLSS